MATWIMVDKGFATTLFLNCFRELSRFMIVGWLDNLFPFIAAKL
jgi:hypothetical protein